MNSEHECFMQEKIESIEKKVDQILVALKGNDMGTTGLIPRLENCERKVTGLRRWSDNIKIYVSLISFFIASVVTLIIAWLTK